MSSVKPQATAKGRAFPNRSLSMVRVVHLFPYLKPGGAERVIVHLLTHLDRRKFEVSGICLADPSGSDLEKMLGEARIPIQYLGKKPGFDLRMYARVHRALNAVAPQILHTHVHVLRYALPYIWYSHCYKQRPVMLHTVHSLAEYEVEPRARYIQRLAFKDGVMPVAVAQEVARSLSRLYGIQNPAVVPNCLPIEIYRRPKVKRETWRQRENFRQEDFLFVCVAGLRPEKNHPLLLQAFARCAVRYPGAHLLLAGGGDTAELERQAAQLGVARQVHFLGVRTDVPDVLAASDVFVLASQYEGNPLCVMEAMAAGLPVVAPCVGGIPELVTSDIEGMLVPPNHAAELANAMERLLQNAGLRSRMGIAGTKRALACFDIPIMMRAYERIYTSLLAGSGNGQQESAEEPEIMADLSSTA